MDMPPLAKPGSEYTKREMGAHYVVDSESSSSYGLTPRAGTGRGMPADMDRVHTKNGTEMDTLNPGTNGEDCGNQIQIGNRSSIVANSGDRQTLVSDPMTQNGSECQPHYVRGRTEWRSYFHQSRSRSLEWTGDDSSSVQAFRTGAMTLNSGYQAGLGNYRSESLERGGPKDRDRGMVTEGRVLLTANSFHSGGLANGHGVNISVGNNSEERMRCLGRAVEKGEWGQTLPIRLTGGQSIWERIEKLFPSEEASKTKGFVRSNRLPLYGGEGHVTTAISGRLRRNSSFSDANPTTHQTYEAESGGRFSRGFSRRGTNSLDLQPHFKISQSSLKSKDFLSSISPVTDYTSRRSSPHSSFAIANPTTNQWRQPYEGRSGGTFPRRFSREGTNSLDLPQNSKISKSSFNSEDFLSSVSPGRDYTWMRSSGTPYSSFSIANPTTNQWRQPYEWGSGGTFPRRSSREGTNSLDFQQNSKISKSPFNSKDFLAPVSPVTDYTWRRSPGSPNSSFSIANATNNQWRQPYEGGSGGTFPRRFSKQGTNSLDSQQNSRISTSSKGSPVTDCTWRSSGTPWQSTLEEKPLEGRSGQWDSGTRQLGTRSLDRGGVLSTQSQATRELYGIMPSAIGKPQPTLEEESAALSPDQPGHTVGRAGRSSEENGTADSVQGRGGVETAGGTSPRLRNAELRMRSAEPEKEKERKETQSDARMLGERKPDREGNVAVESISLTEDVFDSAAPNVARGPTVRAAASQKLIVPSAASVRNKIHQFEIMSQRGRGSTEGLLLKSTRTFSTPALPSWVTEGVQKSASEKSLSRLRGTWAKDRTMSEDYRREEEGSTFKGISRRGRQQSLDGIQSEKQEEIQVAQRSRNPRYEFMDEVGIGLNSRGVDVVESRDVAGSRSNVVEGFGKYSMLKNEPEIPLNTQAGTPLFIDETDICRAIDPERPGKSDASSILTSNPLNNIDPSSSSTEPIGDQNQSPFGISSDTVDGNKTQTEIGWNSPRLSRRPLPVHSTPTSTSIDRTEDKRRSDRYEQTHSTQETSPYRSLVDLAPPVVTDPGRRGKKREEDLIAWVASVNQKIEGCSDNEEDDDDDDDDDGTEKDEDSTDGDYDSDSAESSVTVTSNMSQSDRRSFCVSLADLCNLGGVDFGESGSDSEPWPAGRRSASLSSDASAFSCVSVMPAEELDRLLADVRSLDDNSLQNYNDVEVVVLHKDIGVGLGFSMAGGADQNKPITVHKVFPLGAAAQEGSIRAGDQVLSINGTTLSDLGHWEATRTLRKAKGRGMGVVVLKRGGDLAPSDDRDWAEEPGGAQIQSRDAGQRVRVQLEKQSRDLGFSLEGGVGSSLGDKPLSIQKVFQGGPASQVLPGDEVEEIQGVNTSGMRRLEVWTLIRNLPPGPVDVILRRPTK